VLEKSLTRFKTTKLYVQKKYNLFREESEGYSKLIVALSQHSDSPKNSSESLQRQVSSLIGVFDLDPNRVLDVLLDRFEHCPNNQEMLRLVKKFNAETIVHILGFKLQNEFNSQSSNYSLVLIGAKLIKDGVFNVESLYTHVNFFGFLNYFC
jgi:THO complex subunit 2